MQRLPKLFMDHISNGIVPDKRFECAKKVPIENVSIIVLLHKSAIDLTNSLNSGSNAISLGSDPVIWLSSRRRCAKW